MSGGAFLFLRDRALNARGYFEKFDAAGQPVDLPKAPFNQQQFGGMLGGPIVKNKAFYFASIERQAANDSRAVTIDETTLVPNPIGPGDARHAGVDPARRRLPVRHRHGPVSHEARRSCSDAPTMNLTPAQRLTVRANTGDEINENIEPFGGITAKSRAGALDSRDWMIAGMHGWTVTPHVYNDLRVQVAHPQPGRATRSIRPAAGRASATRWADRRSTSPASPILDGRIHAADTPVAPLSGARHRELANRSAPRQGRARFQHDRFFENGLSTISSAGSTSSWTFPRRLRRCSACPPRSRASRHWRSACPAPTSRVTEIPRLSAASRTFRSSRRTMVNVSSNLSVNIGVRYQVQGSPGYTYRIQGYPGPYEYPPDRNNVAPRALDRVGSGRARPDRCSWFLRHVLRQHVLGDPRRAEDDRRHRRRAGLRDAGAARDHAAWQTPGRQLPDAALTGHPPLQLAVDPGVITPYAHHFSAGVVARAAPGSDRLGRLRLSRRPRSDRADRLQPARAGARAGSPALRTSTACPAPPPRCCSTRRSHDTRYRGLLASVEQALRQPLAVPGQLHAGQDRRQRQRLRRTPVRQRRRPRPERPARPAARVRPGPRLRRIGAGSASSARRQRTHDAAGAIRAVGDPRSGFRTSLQCARRIRFQWRWRRRRRRPPPGTICRLRRPPSASNTGRLPASAALDLRVSRQFAIHGGARIDGILEVFNVLNRTNFTDVNNVFGAGSYPANPLPTFGQFTQAGAPRQAQVAARLTF